MENKFNLKENILFEDDWLLALNKPSDLIVNRSKTAKTKTLQDYLEEEYSFEGDETFVSRSGIVHRLDKDTSGVLIIAKNEKAFTELQKSFKNREIQKEYTALVHGSISHELLEINAPIGRSPVNFRKYAILADGKKSYTKAVKISEINIQEETYSKMKIHPKTGRTHQIRVHFASINHPIAGDSIYCPKALYERDLSIFGRLMLHANKITFISPVDNKKISIESKIPSIFNN